MGELLLVRHGETEWSRDGRHTGRTDVPLTEHGREQALRMRALLADRDIVLARTSPLSRASETAELATGHRVTSDDLLVEWDYGELEGVTTADYRRGHPSWVLWRDGCPGGELCADVGRRTDALLASVLPALDEGDVLLVAHGHLLRILTARRLGFVAEAGACFRLDAATLSALSTEHDIPVVARWNLAP